MAEWTTKTRRFLLRELGEDGLSVLNRSIDKGKWSIPKNLPEDTFRKLLIFRYGVMIGVSPIKKEVSYEPSEQANYRRLLNLLKDPRYGLDMSGLRVLDRFLRTGDLTLPKRGFSRENRIRLTVFRNLMHGKGLYGLRPAVQKRYMEQVDALQRLKVVEKPVKRQTRRRRPGRMDFEPRLVLGRAMVLKVPRQKAQAKAEEAPPPKADLPSKDIPTQWVRILAQVPMDERDYDKLPEGTKARLFASVESYIRNQGLFAFEKAKDKDDNVRTSPFTYLALAAGDLKGVSETYSREVFRAYQDMRQTTLMDTNPGLVLSTIMKAAENNTWRRYTRDDSPEKSRENYQRAVKEIPYDMGRLWRFVKEAKAKTAAEWFKQMPKAKMASGKNTREWLEGYAGRIVERDFGKFGISFDLKGITFADPYLKERFQRDPKSMELVEGVYKKAFVAALFDYLFVMKAERLARRPEDFYDGMMFAQRMASEKLHASLPKIKEIMVQAEKKAAEQIQMVKKGEGPKRKAVA